MSRADHRRADLLDRMADHVLAHGLGAASLRPLAEAAGTSDRMLLYYFRDKAELLAAVLDRLAARLGAELEARAAGRPVPPAALRAALAAAALDDALRPFLRLWLEIAAAAGRGDPVCAAAGQRIARGFLAWTDAQLDLPDPAERAAEAARLLAAIEGLALLDALGLGPEIRDALSPPAS